MWAFFAIEVITLCCKPCIEKIAPEFDDDDYLVAEDYMIEEPKDPEAEFLYDDS